MVCTMILKDLKNKSKKDKICKEKDFILIRFCKIYIQTKCINKHLL